MLVNVWHMYDESSVIHVLRRVHSVCRRDGMEPNSGTPRDDLSMYGVAIAIDLNPARLKTE
jgi:hypothetical protein